MARGNINMDPQGFFPNNFQKKKWLDIFGFLLVNYWELFR